MLSHACALRKSVYMSRRDCYVYVRLMQMAVTVPLRNTRHVIWCLSAALLSLVLIDMISPSDGQAYHFSKGWMPGRKRASATAPLTAATAGHDAVETGPGASAALSEAVRRAVYGEHRDSSPTSAAAVCAMRTQVYRLVVDMIRVSDDINMMASSV
jgi:hypothetical protein